MPLSIIMQIRDAGVPKLSEASDKSRQGPAVLQQLNSGHAASQTMPESFISHRLMSVAERLTFLY